MKSFPKMAGCVPNLRRQGGCYCGRRGLPREWVLQMYEDYKLLGSLAKAGARHGRTRQSMFGLFKYHGLELNHKQFRAVIVYKGRKYSKDDQGYYRDTVFRSSRHTPKTYLHRRIWIEARGPVPNGYTLMFKDGDRTNCRLENLECVSREEQQRRVRTGENGATKTSAARLNLILAGRGRELATVIQ